MFGRLAAFAPLAGLGVATSYVAAACERGVSDIAAREDRTIRTHTCSKANRFVPGCNELLVLSCVVAAPSWVGHSSRP